MIGYPSIINYSLCILGLIVDINAMSVMVEILPWYVLFSGIYSKTWFFDETVMVLFITIYK